MKVRIYRGDHQRPDNHYYLMQQRFELLNSKCLSDWWDITVLTLF